MSARTASFLKCVTRDELARLLEVDVSTLTYFAYSKGKKYKTFTIPKKSGGTRLIMAPVGPLITIQRKLAALLSEVYKQPPYVQGFVEGGSIIENAKLHVNKRHVLNFDLKDFFPSITAGRVIGLLRARPFEFNNEVASAIAGLVCFNGSLPQGAPTSPIISNMICRRMDKALYSLSRSARAVYSRYADDITFSTMRKFFPETILEQTPENLELSVEITNIVQRNYFQINPKKTRLSSNSDPKYVTGVKVNLRLNVQKRYIRRVRAMLHAWEKFGTEQAQAEFTNKYGGGNKPFLQVVRGRLAHIKNVKGEDDLAYRRLYNRFVRLENKGRPELPESEIEDLYSRIFVIHSGGQYGTGFILDGKWLITCDHVVITDEIEYFTFSDYPVPMRKRIKVDPSMRSSEANFDLIAVPVGYADANNPRRTLKSSSLTTEVCAGMKGKTIGFPAYRPGLPPYIMSLEVIAVPMDEDRGILDAYVDKKLISGSSGSPVLNERNEVIGMVCRGTSGRNAADTGFIFLPIQEIRRCLSGFKQPRQPIKTT